jgi:hypothetical protein
MFSMGLISTSSACAGRSERQAERRDRQRLSNTSSRQQIVGCKPQLRVVQQVARKPKKRVAQTVVPHLPARARPATQTR